MARQFSKIPSLIERSGAIVNAVNDDCHESKRLARFVAITQSLCQQKIAQPLALMDHAHPQPCEDCNWQRSSRQFSREIGGQVTEIYLARRQRVEASNRTALIDKDFRGGESLVLMLQRLSLKPIVHFALAAIKWTSRMTSLQRFKREPRRQGDPGHFAPRMMAPSRFWAGVSFGGACRACQKASCSSGLSRTV